MFKGLRKLIGALAITLGLLGAIASIIGITLAVRAGLQAQDRVEDITSAITEPLSSAQERAAEVAANQTAIDGELRSEVISDRIETARSEISQIDEHPVYGWLPIDKDRLTDSLDDSSTVTESRLTTQSAGRLGETLGEAQESVDDFSSSLRFWIRLASIAGIAFGLWALLGQLALMGWGRRRRKKVKDQVKAKSEEEKLAAIERNEADLAKDEEIETLKATMEANGDVAKAAQAEVESLEEAAEVKSLEDTSEFETETTDQTDT